MSYSLDHITAEVATAISELMEHCQWKKPKLLIIGASTSEVAGEHIGSAGALDIAQAIYTGLQQAKGSFIPVFQCCEHLNRAIVVERELAEAMNLPIVQAKPIPKAGGSMAAYAYSQLEDPCLVESIAADAGIDIGDTFIGMHLKSVVVPFRASIRSVGSAHVTLAFTRPKLIGGERAVYE
ncbi:TIGR01440 family protein [Paenibacillus septentrionalis]|uniref:UPF0340 protein ACFP56_20185 n=1 Tax=Paenibacillus septentrionalis TaxID=429342 RepID=A0ABW1V852_9BACL